MTVLWERPAPETRKGADLAVLAVAIADREGLAALSVKRVATLAGVPPKQLGAYLTSKDDLFDLIFDAYYAEIAIPERGAGDWRADLHSLALATKDALDRHPWALELMGARPPYGPHGLRNSERALATVDGLGLAPREMTSAVNAVLAYVCGSIRRSGAPPSDEVAHYLLTIAATAEFPLLAAVFRDSAQLTARDSFEAGLQHVLDGIAARIDRPAQS